LYHKERHEFLVMLLG